MAELADHALIDRALERHDQVGNVLQRLPPPRSELSLDGAIGMQDIDFALGTGEAQREPFLRLAAKPAFPGLTGDLARYVVFEPFRDLADAFHGANIGFFAKFPQRGGPRLFAVVDATLRKLPGMGQVDVFGSADAAADKSQAVAVEKHDADARTVWKIFEGHYWASGEGGWRSSLYSLLRDFTTRPLHVCFAFVAAAVIGTRSKPRPAAALAHWAI